MPCALETVPTSQGGAAVRIDRTDTCDYVVFATGERESLTAGRIQTDARIAWLRERPRAAAIIDGTRLTFQEKSAIQTESAQGIEVR